MKTIKEYKITIKEDSDINEILKQINFIKQQVKNKKKYEMQDLSKINILTKQPRIRSKTRTVLVPTRKED
jgi:adenylate cyclase class IV